MCQAQKVKKFEFWRARSGGNPHRGTPNFCFVEFIFNIYPFRKFDPSSCNGVKVQSFGGPDWGGSLNLAPSILVAL